MNPNEYIIDNRILEIGKDRHRYIDKQCSNKLWRINKRNRVGKSKRDIWNKCIQKLWISTNSIRKNDKMYDIIKPNIIQRELIDEELVNKFQKEEIGGKNKKKILKW